MSIESHLQSSRVSLDELNLSSLRISSSDQAEVKGAIANHLVEQWLKRAGARFQDGFPTTRNGTQWELGPNGIIVRENGSAIHEFDHMVYLRDTPYVVEVKSMKLNGFKEKIPRALELAKEFYGCDAELLLFFPQYSNKKQDGIYINQEYPLVHCIDIGYKKKQLNHVVNMYLTRGQSKN